MPLFEEFNFCGDGKIYEGVKQKYPPTGYKMTPKQAQPLSQPHRACPVGTSQGWARKERLCWDLVNVGIWWL